MFFKNQPLLKILRNGFRKIYTIWNLLRGYIAMEFYWIGFAVTFGQYYVQRVVACDTVQARIFLIKLISLNKTWMIFQFWINRTVGKHLFLEVFYLGLLAHSLYHFWVSQFRVNSFANFKTNQQLFFTFMKEITFWALAFYRHCDPVISGWGLIPEIWNFNYAVLILIFFG